MYLFNAYTYSVCPFNMVSYVLTLALVVYHLQRVVTGVKDNVLILPK